MIGARHVDNSQLGASQLGASQLRVSQLRVSQLIGVSGSAKLDLTKGAK